MKKAFYPLISLMTLCSLVACTNASAITDLKAEPSGHFTDIQLNYLKNDNYADTTPYNGNMSKYAPAPVKISWNASSKDYQLVLNAEKDVDAAEYSISGKEFEFFNPMIGVSYTATVKYGNYQESVTFKEEVTVPGPRNVYVDGVENFRDIGGWGKFVDGKYQTYMKQGMVYRSGRLNEDKEQTVKASISSDGLNEVNNHLKIKTEIDLRRTSTNEVGGLTNKSVLGDNVNYIQLPMVFNGNNVLTFKGTVSNDNYEYDNPAMIRQFFDVLANETNYPINFHCSIGKDRTGCLAYLIEGLMGFDQETMYRDYMFTNFANAGMCKMSDLTDRYGKTLDEYNNGETLQQKVYNYLNQEIGVSTANLDNVIKILKA